MKHSLKHAIDTLRIAALFPSFVICLGLCETHPVAGVAIFGLAVWQLNKVDPSRLPK